MYELVKLNNGKEVQLAPLTLFWVEALDGIMKENNGNLSKEYKTMGDLLYQSFIRKNPELTREELSNSLDASDINNLFAKLLVVSGLVKENTEEGSEAKK